ncbi:hypothetical protein [Methanosphaera sp.]|jgi:hypothetical protein|uniref:hypothetical protein n=1 Tax=Methanosphaera sp. TaxID=2666342 RepID=UPI003D8FCBCD
MLIRDILEKEELSLELSEEILNLEWGEWDDKNPYESVNVEYDSDEGFETYIFDSKRFNQKLFIKPGSDYPIVFQSIIGSSSCSTLFYKDGSIAKNIDFD